MSAPIVQTLPMPPIRGTDTQSQFDTKADAFLTALPNFGNQQNTLATWMNTTSNAINQRAVQTAADSVVAQQAGQAAVSIANFKGDWQGLTGALAVPATVLHNGNYWALLSNTNNVALIEPSISSQWALAPVAGYNNFLQSVRSKAIFIADFVRNEFKRYESPYGQEPKTLLQSVTNTRASDATRNTPFGVETVGANIVRIEHDPLTGRPRGALNEPVDTNSFIRSGLLTDAAWPKTRCNVTLSTQIAQSGEPYFLLESTAAAAYYINQHFSVIAGVQRTISFYVKNINFTTSYVRVIGTVFRFNNLTGEAGTSAVISFRSILQLDGGFRVFITWTPTTTGIEPVQIGVIDNAAGDSVLMTSMQVDNFGGSYIPTTTNPVARITDAMRTQFTSRFLNDTFSFMVDVTPTGLGSDGTNRLISFAASDAATGDRIGIDIDAGGTRLRFRSSGISGTPAWTPSDPAVLFQRMRIVGRISKTQGLLLWVNGTMRINSAVNATSAIDLFRFVCYGITTVAGGNQGKQIYHEAMVFPSGLSDAESLALSAPVGS